MSEYIELEKRKGNFYSKCKGVLLQAKETYKNLRPKVESLESFDLESEISRKRDYLTYDHSFNPNKRNSPTSTQDNFQFVNRTREFSDNQHQ